jgi:hypothetical protein
MPFVPANKKITGIELVQAGRPPRITSKKQLKTQKIDSGQAQFLYALPNLPGNSGFV